MANQNNTMQDNTTQYKTHVRQYKTTQDNIISYKQHDIPMQSNTRQDKKHVRTIQHKPLRTQRSKTT